MSSLLRARHDSVTWVEPSSTDVNDHDHSAHPSATPPATHANRRPSSAAVTSLRVSYTSPLSERRFTPTNQAPTVGPAPSSQRPPWQDGLHSPIRPMSVTIS